MVARFAEYLYSVQLNFTLPAMIVSVADGGGGGGGGGGNRGSLPRAPSVRGPPNSAGGFRSQSTTNAGMVVDCAV